MLYILVGCLQYGESDMLGVYRTLDEARFWAREVALEQGGYDSYEIVQKMLSEEAGLPQVVDTLNSDAILAA